ncbi:hypothetical protein BDA99DRAFT_328651 [Phascolomyces articulosus]|uniref:Uncharacterized protein n=1 Tax=Phascolomyces articulosus TaxID=60185 RepID=A0AAD5KHD5_9FUNG|nr:hypothetical protein BDA99DRAFT_328651 [Phascolomyces articulosus]
MFIPGYNTARLDDQERQILEHILCISLLIILDKSDESNWFTIKRNNTIPLDNNFDTTTTVNTMTNVNNNGTNSNKKTEPIMELPLTPSNSKKEQKRNKIEREVQQKLERDIRRTQKQILFEDNYNVIKRSATNSASSSKNNSPQVSPLPTPNTSTKTSSTTKTLSRQKSTSLLRDRLTINSQLANMKLLQAPLQLLLLIICTTSFFTTHSPHHRLHPEWLKLEIIVTLYSSMVQRLFVGIIIPNSSNKQFLPVHDL